jgi:hypothetical protein
MTRYTLSVLPALLVACAGAGPDRPLESFLAESRLPAGAPVVLVDLDDTVYDRAVDRPMHGAAAALGDLAADHLIVYLTARPTCAKLPGVTHNRGDSEEFLEANGFPAGPLFTSSLCNWLFLGEGGGKHASFRQLREYGIDRVDLAVGDRPHDLEVYINNEHVTVERAVIILIEDDTHRDPDREELPPSILSREIAGSGAAWPRILSAYRGGELPRGGRVIVSEPQCASTDPPELLPEESGSRRR